MREEFAQCPDRSDLAARDGVDRLAAMPLSVGRYLRSLGPQECDELGQWLLRRAGQLKSENHGHLQFTESTKPRPNDRAVRPEIRSSRSDLFGGHRSSAHVLDAGLGQSKSTEGG
jgi:hypothetical protein